MSFVLRLPGVTQSVLAPAGLISPALPASAATFNETGGNTEVTHNSITWTLEGTGLTTGNYLTGDAFIEDSITVLSVSPAPNATSHGSMVNPATGYLTPQGYEDGASGFSAASRVSFPYEMSPGESLVSSRTDPNGTDNENKAGWVLDHAVLTCVTPGSASSNHFRPPYTGSDKTTFTFQDLDISGIPTLTPVGDDLPTASYLISTTEKVWVDHRFEFNGRAIHAVNNMPVYGAEMTGEMGAAILGSCLDWPDSDRYPLIRNIVQFGLDCYGLVQNGQYWPANGGHSSGRYLPILYAGKLLNNSGMLNVKDYDFVFQEGDEGFAENCQTYGAGLYGIRWCSRSDTSQNYLSVNAPTWVSQSLGARILGLQSAWDHEPFFQLVANWCDSPSYGSAYNAIDEFAFDMWDAYNDTYPSGY